jgi:Tol biopolymer transport system component
VLGTTTGIASNGRRGRKPERYAMTLAWLLVAGLLYSGETLGRPAPSTPAAGTPELFEPGTISSGFDDSHPSFSPDGTTLYFLRNTPDFMNWTILQSSLVGGKWSAPQVAPFSGRWNDADVFISSDGKWLFFISDRPAPGRAAGRADTDLWMMEKGEGGWGEPRHIAELSSTGFEWFPTMTSDGVLYFGSEREGGHGASDIWRSRFDGERFSEPENLGPAINSAEQEIEPLISADDRYLIFAAKRDATSKGSYDLFISHNCDGRWSSPRPLPGDINSSGWDFSPRLSPDGALFYFTSNRSTFSRDSSGKLTLGDLHARLSGPGNGLRDIYRVSASALPLHPSC